MADQLLSREVVEIVGDDSKLVATLKRDEKIVTSSVGNMQGSLGALKLDAALASQAFGALGQAASLTGNQMLATVAQAGAMTAAFAGLATGLGGVKVAVIGVVSAMGPLVLIAAAVVAVGVAIFAVWNKGKKEMAEAAEVSDRLEASLRKQRETTQGLISTLDQQLAIARGEEDRFTFIKGASLAEKEILRDKTAELELIKQQKADAKAIADSQKKQADDAASAARTLEDRKQSLRDQIDIVKGIKTQEDLIVDAEERQLAVRLKLTQETKVNRAESERTAEAERKTAVALRDQNLAKSLDFQNRIQNKQFAQAIDLSTTAVGAGGTAGQKQIVEAPEFKEMVKLLRRANELADRGVRAVA